MSTLGLVGTVSVILKVGSASLTRLRCTFQYFARYHKHKIINFEQVIKHTQLTSTCPIKGLLIA